MKMLFINFLICSFVSVGFGQTFVNVVPNTLPKTMRAMSTDLKKISSQVHNVKKNPSSAMLADDFTGLVLHAKTFTPDSIRSLPRSQQPAAKSRFDQRLNNVAQLGRDLGSAFRANSNSVAVTILRRLNQAMKDGHAEFRP